MSEQQSELKRCVELGDVRRAWLFDHITIGELVQDFEAWCRQDVWLTFECEARVFQSLARKRGNPVYIHQMRLRLDDLSEVLERFIRITGSTSNAIFVTLTDAQRGRVQDAWRDVGTEFNRFMAALRKRYGRVKVIRSWESTANGWPHVHALLIFESADFQTVEVNGISRPRGTIEWRGYWRKGFIDARSCTRAKGAAWYLAKELLKYSAEISVNVDQGRRTQALLWVNRKRSFSISRELQLSLAGLDRAMRNSNRFGLPPGAKFRFLGLSSSLGRVKPGQKEGQWCYEVDGPPPDLHERWPKPVPVSEVRHERLYPIAPKELFDFIEPIYDEVDARTRARITRLCKGERNL